MKGAYRIMHNGRLLAEVAGRVRAADVKKIARAVARVPNPTLVHHGLAKGAAFHITSTLSGPIADVYVSSPVVARAIAQLVSNAIGEQVEVTRNTLAGKGSVHSRVDSREPRGRARFERPSRNPVGDPVPGEVWTTLAGGRCKVLAVNAVRVQVLHQETGEREWINRGDFFASYRPPRRRNPSRSSGARLDRYLKRKKALVPRRVYRARAAGRSAKARYFGQRTLQRMSARADAAQARRDREDGRMNPARRDIPPGKILRAEYGTFPSEDMVQVTKLAEGWSPKARAQVSLVEVSPGWQLAGSAATWTNGYFAVWWQAHGARQGQQYKTLEPARAHFDKLVTVPNPKGRNRGFSRTSNRSGGPGLRSMVRTPRKRSRRNPSTAAEAAADIVHAAGWHGFADDIRAGRMTPEHGLRVVAKHGSAAQRAIAEKALRALSGHGYRAGRRTPNPSGRNRSRRTRKSPSSELARAKRTSQMWNEFPATSARRVRVRSRVIPRHLVKLGELDAVVYRSKKYSGKPTLYEHRFKRPLPVLTSDPDGRAMHIVGGGFKITGDGLVN